MRACDPAGTTVAERFSRKTSIKHLEASSAKRSLTLQSFLTAAGRGIVLACLPAAAHRRFLPSVRSCRGLACATVFMRVDDVHPHDDEIA